MKIRIDVTEEHINQGKPDICGECPVALAVREHFPGHIVSANFNNITIESFSSKYTHLSRYRLAYADRIDEHDVAEFMCLFDNGEQVYELVFDLEIDIPAMLGMRFKQGYYYNP